MKTHTASKNRAKRHAELKKQIAKRLTGVKEVMDVYNQWKEVHKTKQAHQAVKNSVYVSYNLDASASKPFSQTKKERCYV